MRFYPDAVHQYVTDPASGLTSKASRDAYKKTLRGLHDHRPDHKLEDFTEHDLVSFANRSDLAPSTRASYRTRLVGFFGWAHWRGLIDQNPAANLKRLVSGHFSSPVREAHWLTTAEVEKILNEIEPTNILEERNLLIVRLGFTTGLRRNEITEVTWEGVDLDRQSLSILGKGRKRGIVYLPDRTAGALRSWRVRAVEGLGRVPVKEPVIPRVAYQTDFATGYHYRVYWDRPVSTSTVARAVKELGRRTGFEVAPHDLRRTYANMLVEHGLPIEDISSALRHSNIGTTQRYLEKRQDAGYAAVKKLGLNV